MTMFQKSKLGQLMIILLVTTLLLVGLAFGLVILVLEIGPVEDTSSPETITSIAKTNDALGTYFVQTITQLAITTTTSNDMTNNSAITPTLSATSGKVEAVPMPSLAIAPTPEVD